MKHLALGVMILHYKSTSECAGLEQKTRYFLGTLKYSLDAKCDPTRTCRRERREKILPIFLSNGDFFDFRFSSKVLAERRCIT